MLALISLLLSGSALAAPPCEQIVHPAGTEQRVNQLNGYDYALSFPGLSDTGTRSSLLGADLGSPVFFKDRLYFFFGDTLSTDPNRTRDIDTVATTDQWKNPAAIDSGLRLDFINEPNTNRYRGLTVDGHVELTNSVPYSGFSDGKRMYLFWLIDPDPHGIDSLPGGDPSLLKTWMTVFDPATLNSATLFALPFPFLNVTANVVDTKSVPHLDQIIHEKRAVLIFGKVSTHNPVLAVAPLSRVSDLTSWNYFVGEQGDIPLWTTSADKAAAIYSHPTCASDLNATFDPDLDRWIILHNCWVGGNNRRIYFQTAPKPWGPWTDDQVLVDWDNDCRYFRQGPPQNCGPYFPLWGPNVSGNLYSANRVPQFSRFDAKTRTSTVYFTLSTFNPYTSILMRADLQKVSTSGSCL